MAINVRAPFAMMQKAIGQMLPGESGSIVNLASTAGHRASRLAGPYSTSKSAVLAMTRCAAAEYSHKGINVNSVSPGALERPNIQGFSAEVSDMHCASLTELIHLARKSRASETRSHRDDWPRPRDRRHGLLSGQQRGQTCHRSRSYRLVSRHWTGRIETERSLLQSTAVC